MEISCEGKRFLSSSLSAYLVVDVYANDRTDSFPPFAKAAKGWGTQTPANYLLVKSKGAKLIRLRRQTIQVWASEVSMSVKAMSFDFSHALNLRLSSMR